jgi:AcrR family transcriptional regulator
MSRQPAGAAVQREDVTRAIRRALLQELAERGYGATSIDAVVRRAGVGKAALYRRWPSKLELVIDTIAGSAVRPQDVPDTGGLREDVLAFLRSGAAILTHPLGRRILPDLLAEAARTPELGRALDASIGTPRRRLGRRILDAAVARGELPADVDVELAMDLIPGPLYWRTSVRRGELDDAALERLTTALVAGLQALSDPGRPR